MISYNNNDNYFKRERKEWDELLGQYLGLSGAALEPLSIVLFPR